jgi:hypothetical protein
VAGAAVRAFAPIFSAPCAGTSTSRALGALDCARYDATFATALTRNVVRPLAERGIEVPAADVAAAMPP